MRRLRLHDPERRSCGDCTACCEHLGVDELEKPAGQRCEHQRPAGDARRFGGCRIYDTRPGSCRSYACLWALGVGGREDRPDKSGVICEQEVSFTNKWGKQSVLIRELRPDAARWGPFAKLVAQKVLGAPGGGTVVVRKPDGGIRFTTTDPAARTRAAEAAEKLGKIGEVVEWGKP